ncbi:MAG: hypothetical protein WC530_06970 [Candidatus Omnitrophota bacterium]|jgi:hypothetical protein
MKATFKITRKLFETAKNDLLRRHKYAHERVGWLRCRLGDISESEIVILAHDYFPVDDNDYIKTSKAAAMINSSAIRKALQLVLDKNVSLFHLHLHNHNGSTTFSGVDRRENNKLIPDFWNVRPEMPHGAIVFSRTSLTGRCWYQKGTTINFSKAIIVGTPIVFIGV